MHETVREHPFFHIADSKDWVENDAATARVRDCALAQLKNNPHIFYGIFVLLILFYTFCFVSEMPSIL